MTVPINTCGMCRGQGVIEIAGSMDICDFCRGLGGSYNDDDVIWHEDDADGYDYNIQERGDE